MPAYGLPGVTTTPRAARVAGLAVAVATAAGVLATQLIPNRPDPATMAVTVRTERIGTGVETGSDVRFAGVRIGSVTGVDREADGSQRLEMRIDRTDSVGLTDALSLDYAPGNLFGISEVVLKPGSGGTALIDASVIDLTGPNAGRAADATISALLNSLGQFTNDVLTPQLTAVLSKIATETRAFAPLMQAIVTTMQAVADTQRLPSSFLLEQYGSTLAGLPPTVRGLLDLLNAPFSNAYLAQPGKIDKFNANLDMIKDDLLTAANDLLITGRTHYAEYVDILTPLLTALAHTVPRPQQSSAELAELLRRLHEAMPDNGNGPVLNLSVALRGVPAVAVPLAGLLGATPTPAGGER
ncbi:MlaD family protein [Nocardia inohanensis]|uniref:MlaD family protein n=1 Tax=Nocardia inohanensis TaxID=209246 RepID=UPI00082E0C57|nr:MlaD family protein [Nocardia inohanensis]